MNPTGLLILACREHASFRGRDIADGNRIGQWVLSQGRDDVRRELERLCQDRPPPTVREDYRKPAAHFTESCILICCQDYFEGIERLLKMTAPLDIPSNSSYSKSALRKVVKEYNSKDIRKQIDALFKRVEKHFTEASDAKATAEESSGIPPGTVMVGVWKACEDEVLRITELFNKRIAQCYPDTGVTLEYTAGDVESAFKRHGVSNTLRK